MQPTLHEFFCTHDQFYDEEYHCLRLWHELIKCYKMKYFGYTVLNIPVDVLKPAAWFNLGGILPTSHPLCWPTFKAIMTHRNHTLPILQTFNFRWWVTMEIVEFEALTMQTILGRMFTADELLFALSKF
jgi:hypothetical protein